MFNFHQVQFLTGSDIALVMERNIARQALQMMSNDHQAFFKALSKQEKAHFDSMVNSNDVNHFKYAIGYLVGEKKYREGDFEQLWKQRKHAKVISSFFDYMGHSEKEIGRKYTDVALGFPVTYEFVAVRNDLVLHGFLRKTLVSMTQKGETDLTLQDLYYFLPVMKALYAVHYPDKHLNPVLRYGEPDKQTPKKVSPVSKDQALNNVLREIGQIFRNPALACHYLKNLENKLQKLSGKNSIEKELEGQFEWRSHMAVYYPVPNEKFVPVKQQHLLSRALHETLKPFEIGTVHLKLFSLVEKDTIHAVISKGYYFTESTLNHNMLLHGKITHMIQILLICELIKAGELSTQYMDGEQAKHLTIHDVLDRLLKPLNAGSTRLAWDEYMDNVNQFDYKYCFQNPYITHSYLMMHGEFHGLPLLSAAMKTSFFKNFVKCRDFYTDFLHQKENKLSTDDLWTIICLTDATNLLPYDETKALEHSLRNKPKEVEVQVHKGESFSPSGATKSPYYLVEKRKDNLSQQLTLPGTKPNKFRRGVQ